MSEKLLLVEDEADLRYSLSHNLAFEGYQVVEAANGRFAWERFQEHEFALVILDIMMPEIDGLTLLKKIRAANAAVPIMMLTAKATEMDKVIGFELGADDYLTKPFGLGEFLARVKALLRRNRPARLSPSIVKFLSFEVDFQNFSLKKGDREISLTQKEFSLLKYLIQRPRQALDKSQILDDVWGYASRATTRTIDTHIARLRRKLGDQHANRIIQTIPTVGYKFIAEIKS